MLVVPGLFIPPSRSIPQGRFSKEDKRGDKEDRKRWKRTICSCDPIKGKKGKRRRNSPACRSWVTLVNSAAWRPQNIGFQVRTLVPEGQELFLPLGGAVIDFADDALHRQDALYKAESHKKAVHI